MSAVAATSQVRWPETRPSIIPAGDASLMDCAYKASQLAHKIRSYRPGIFEISNLEKHVENEYASLDQSLRRLISVVSIGKRQIQSDYPFARPLAQNMSCASDALFRMLDPDSITSISTGSSAGNYLHSPQCGVAVCGFLILKQFYQKCTASMREQREAATDLCKVLIQAQVGLASAWESKAVNTLAMPIIDELAEKLSMYNKSRSMCSCFSCLS